MNRFVGKSIQVDNSPQNLASSTLNKRYLLTEYGVDTVSFKSGVRPTSHDNPTNIELDYQHYQLFQDILNHARSVNIDPEKKYKAAINVLVTLIKDDLAVIDQLNEKPEIVVRNSRSKKQMQLGRPYKVYGSGCLTHVVIPTEYDSKSKCYKCVSNEYIEGSDGHTSIKTVLVLIHEQRLIADYTLRNVLNYTKFSNIKS